MYLGDTEVVRVRQRDKLNPTSTDPVVTSVYLHPKEPDLREMLADTPLSEQIRGAGPPPPPSHGGAVTAQPSQPPGAAGDAGAVGTADAAALAAGYMEGAALRQIDVDAKGRALARGRRKASSARVWLSHGVGDVSVNHKPLGAYFNSHAHRAAVISPLTTVGAPGQWNVHATVEGGGAAPPAI